MQWDKLFSSGVFIDDVLYSNSEHEHLFMKINVDSGKCKFLVPQNYNANEWQYTEEMIAVGNDIYILEQNGCRLLKYSLENNVCDTWEINNHKYEYLNCAGLYKYCNTLYIISSWKCEIIKFNLETGNISFENIIIERKKKINRIGKDKYARKYTSSCLIGANLYIFSGRDGYVLCKNLDTERIIVLDLPNEIQGCTSAIWNKDSFFVLSKDNQLFSWDGDKRCQLIWKSNNKEILQYRLFIVTQKNIWVLPALGTDIIVIDKTTKENKIFKEYPKGYKYINKSSTVAKYYNAIKYKEGYYVAASVGSHMLYVDEITGKGKWIFLNYELKDKIDFIRSDDIRKYRELFCSQTLFLELVEQSVIYNTLQEQNIGKKIWRKTNECM